MEDLWSFSPTSDSYLQRFLTVADENQAPESRFLQFFQQRENSPNNEKNGVSLCLKEEDLFQIEDKKMETFQNIIDAEDLAHYSFVIENNLEARFTDIVQECVKDRTLFIIFAENLHQGVIDKFLNYALKQTNVPEAFIKGVFTDMYPILLRKENSRAMIELLIKSFTSHKELFASKVFPLLFVKEISEELFFNLVKTLDDENKKEMLLSMCHIKLIGEQFVKHLPAILELYKDIHCKTNEMQKYILHYLILNNDICCNDRTYGRLLLTFLQNTDLKTDGKELVVFTNLVRNHFSIFQRPCEDALKALSMVQLL